MVHFAKGFNELTHAFLDISLLDIPTVFIYFKVLVGFTNYYENIWEFLFTVFWENYLHDLYFVGN